MGASQPRLISSYLDTLAAQLPASIVEELADGLTETHRSYLRQGLAPDLAAESAVAEFGQPEAILAGFARVNPARRAARRLLGIGPAVGVCWVAALIAGRAWPPLPARIVIGLALLASIGLLAAAARGGRYRLAARTGVAGCVGMAALDLVMITGVTFVVTSVTWVTAVAMAASAARIAVTARALRPVLAR